MALWLVRAGRHGEHEQRFFDTGRIYVTWSGLDADLGKLKDVKALRGVLEEHYPDFGPKKIINNASQIWPFAHDMNVGDWVVLPNRRKSVIHVAEITGPYVFHPKGPDPYFHSRTVKWVGTDIPRSHFGRDLLYSFGAFMTICEVKRNDAENRVRAMGKSGWKPETSGRNLLRDKGARDDDEAEVGADGDEPVDLEQLARDGIAKLIMAKFKGHGLARLVDAVLRAQGYSTYVSPAGADKGVDILAAPEPLGFGQPRICVQVKSEQGAVDRPTLDQLIGTMQNVHADQGLLVAWGGFKASVERELASQFFRVRLWDQKSFIDELLNHYDKLDEQIRAELPLKRIWIVAADEEEE